MLWVIRIPEGYVEGVALELGPKIWGRKERERKSIHSMLARWHEPSLGG